jgi:O-acetyl-ADP-ribose deacetylase (regulator of RNase III)
MHPAVLSSAHPHWNSVLPTVEREILVNFTKNYSANAKGPSVSPPRADAVAVLESKLPSKDADFQVALQSKDAGIKDAGIKDAGTDARDAHGHRQQIELLRRDDVHAGNGAAKPLGTAPASAVERVFRLAVGKGQAAKTVTIRLIDTDITRWQGDVIVNAANEVMLGGSGVDGAIHDAAGPELEAACRRIERDKSSGHRCKVGEAKLTKGPFRGSTLGASHVIHTVGPRGSAQNRAQLLASAYTSSLDLVVQNGYSSVAFPSISTGIFQYPRDEAASTAARAIASFLQEHKDIKSLTSIDLCILDGDPSNVVLWSQALKSLLKSPKALEGPSVLPAIKPSHFPGA